MNGRGYRSPSSREPGIEIVKAAGTKYTPSPTLVGLKKAVKEEKLEKVAVVGTPCQIRGLSRLTDGPKKNIRYKNSVYLKIGLFCMETFNYDSFIERLSITTASSNIYRRMTSIP